MKIRTIIFLILLTLIVLSSCSPQKRLSRLVQHYPELTISDTIKIIDTVITSEISIDTAFHYSLIKDTVVITKEKIRLQLIKINDTIYIDVHHAADTIIITKNIPIERIILQEPTEPNPTLWDKYKFQILITLIILAVLTGIVLRIGKFLK